MNKVFEIDHGENYWVSAPSKEKAISFFKERESISDEVHPDFVKEIPEEDWEKISFSNPDEADGLPKAFNCKDWMQKFDRIDIIGSTEYN